jgi:hypothetical protein
VKLTYAEAIVRALLSFIIIIGWGFVIASYGGEYPPSTIMSYIGPLWIILPVIMIFVVQIYVSWIWAKLFTNEDKK